MMMWPRSGMGTEPKSLAGSLRRDKDQVIQHAPPGLPDSQAIDQFLIATAHKPVRQECRTLGPLLGGPGEPHKRAH